MQLDFHKAQPSQAEACHRTGAKPSAGLVSLRKFARRRGILLLEVMLSVGFLTIAIASTVAGLLVANRQALTTRSITAARLVVERNIENALAVNWEAGSTPAILALTSSGGAVWDDDGGGDNKVNILVQDSSGTSVLLKGTLTRTVTDETNAQGAPVRRITFRLDYPYAGKNLSVALSTMRTTDDF